MSYLFYIFALVLSLQTRWLIVPGVLNNGFFEYGSVSLFGVDLVGFVIVFFALYQKLSLRGAKATWQSAPSFPRRRESTPKRLWIPALARMTLLLFLLWLLISLLWNPQPLVATAWILRVVLASTVAWIFVRQVKIRGQKFLWTSLGWFVAGITLQAGLGIYQFLSQSTFANKWLGLAWHDAAAGGTFVVETVLRRWLRAYGGLPHPNVLAAFIVVALIIVVARYVWRQSQLPASSRQQLTEIGWLLSFVILVTGLVLTFSRAGWGAAGLVMVLAWFVVIARRERKATDVAIPAYRTGRPVEIATPRQDVGARDDNFSALSRLALLTVVAVAVSGMLVVTYPDPFTSRLSGQGRLEIKSLSERKQQLLEGWQLFLQRPFLGWGVTSYTRALHDQVRNPNQAVWDYQPAHFVWLTMLVELGAVGFLFMVLVLAFVIARRERKATDVAIPAYRTGRPVEIATPRQDVGARDDSIVSRFIILSLLSTFFLQTLTDHFWWTLPVGVWLTVWIFVLAFSVDNSL